MVLSGKRSTLQEEYAFNASLSWGAEGLRMRKMLRFGGIAIVLAFVSFVLAGASGASDHQVFSDAIGDAAYAGGYAPDITALDVTTTDEGGFTFRISISELNGTFYQGDTVTAMVDSDLNASTGGTVAGYTGIESAIYIQILSAAPFRTYTLCNWGTSAAHYTCEPFDQGVKTEKTGANSLAVTLTGTQGGWFTVGLRVYASFQYPANPSAGTWVDRAPDSGLYPYDARADPDGDGVSGTDDKCVHTSGGPLDGRGGERDGCPPFLPTPRFNFVASPAGGSLLFRSLRMSNAGPAAVTARLGGLTVRRRGSGPLPRVAGRRLSIGSLVTFIYTSPNYFGSYKVARLTRSGFRTVSTGCTPPGRTVFMSCDKVRQ